ncbi:glycosyltransferase [Albibacterium sp.]|uniref:glycosyltransferase n=1 Tax=Albibacterium sp. TaxID=2952885 RepID=UPI002BD8A219|nr:glycosyltransferase [Albibacterium sp.]HUH19108.1 glycosyltransferase [Albibacterium sp.]
MDSYFIYIPLIVFGLAWILQFWYLIIVYRKLAVYKIKELPEDASYPPLSVVICAKNEEENLKQNLESILNQDYPDFEVVLVNDCSSDDSEWVLKDLSKRYSHLNVVTLKEDARFKHGKKFAVTIGIKGAKNQLMVFTDADCKPQSDQWLKHMGNSFASNKEIVLGYSPYNRLPGFLNMFIRFETFHTAISYLSYALKHNAYMGVGRNMAYSEDLFFKGKGFASHMHIPSGDDDLFVNQNATKQNTAICIHPDAQVWSEPKTSYSSYSLQKARHHGASKAYKSKHKWMLSMQVSSAVMFYIAFIAGMFLYPEFRIHLAAAYFVRLAVQMLIYRSAMKKLQVLDLLLFIPLLDIFFYFYTAFNGFFSLFRREVRWK